MEDKLAFLPLLLVLFLAFVVPPLIARFRWLPVVVGEILVGIAVGRSGFGLIQSDPTLDFLAELGLAILMFISGLEIDFSLLFSQTANSRTRAGPLLLAAVSFALTLALATACAWFLASHGLTEDIWMVGLILSTTSLGVVLPILKERGLGSSPLGQALLLAAILADFLTMFLITIYVTLRSRGLSLNILLVGVLFVAALAAYRIGRLAFHRTRAAAVLDDLLQVSSQTQLHAAIALLFGFVILANFLGSEMILGAFLAGAVLSLLNSPGLATLRHKLDAIGFGFFIPLFFITVGIRFDLRAVLQSRETWLVGPLLVAAAYLVKVLSAVVFKVRFSWKEVLAGGVLLSARLSLIIAASGIGLALGAISASTNAAFILVAAVTATLSPVLFNALLPGRRRYQKRPVAIVGVTDIGLQVAKELRGQAESVVFIESGAGPSAAARAAGFAVLEAPGAWPGLRAFDLPPVMSLLVVTPDDDRNLAICREAKSLTLPHIVVLVHDPVRLPEFQELDVQTFTPALYRATLLALMARNPDLFHLLTSGRAGYLVREVVLGNPHLSGRSLRDLRLGGDALVLSIHRGQDYIVPHGGTKLELGDWVTIYGEEEALEALRVRFESG